MSKLNYCGFCCNAFVEPDLDHNNDLGYLSVGRSSGGYSMHIRSGDKRPTAIIVSKWDDTIKQNVDISEYKMKYCPNCGRFLFENEKYS